MKKKIIIIIILMIQINIVKIHSTEKLSRNKTEKWSDSNITNNTFEYLGSRVKISGKNKYYYDIIIKKRPKIDYYDKVNPKYNSKDRTIEMTLRDVTEINKNINITNIKTYLNDVPMFGIENKVATTTYENYKDKIIIKLKKDAKINIGPYRAYINDINAANSMFLLYEKYFDIREYKVHCHTTGMLWWKKTNCGGRTKNDRKLTYDLGIIATNKNQNSREYSTGEYYLKQLSSDLRKYYDVG